MHRGVGKSTSVHVRGGREGGTVSTGGGEGTEEWLQWRHDVSLGLRW